MIEPSIWRFAPPIAWLLILRRWIIPSLVRSARPDDIDARRAAKQRAAAVVKQLEALAETDPVVIPRWPRVLVGSVGWATFVQFIALIALSWLPPSIGEAAAEPLFIALAVSLAVWAVLSTVLIRPAQRKKSGR